MFFLDFSSWFSYFWCRFGCLFCGEEGKDGAFVDVLKWEMARRSVAEETVENSSLILAEGRARRRDPLNSFTRYGGGWNISNGHYWAVSGSFFRQLLFFILILF